MKTNILGLLAVALLARPMSAGAVTMYVPTFTGTSAVLPSAEAVVFPSPTLNITVGTGSLTVALPSNMLPADSYLWLYSGIVMLIVDDTVGRSIETSECPECSPNSQGTLTFIAISAVPEPGTLALLGLGLVGPGVSARRKVRCGVQTS